MFVGYSFFAFRYSSTLFSKCMLSKREPLLLVLKYPFCALRISSTNFSKSFIAFCNFYCSEYLVHHLWNDGVAIGFEGFCAPFSERNGKAVHIKGKPIISSVNRGDRREVLPSDSEFITLWNRKKSTSPFGPLSPASLCLSDVLPFAFDSSTLARCSIVTAKGVGNIPLPAIADRLCPICEFGFHVFVHFTPSMAVGVGSMSITAACLS